MIESRLVVLTVLPSQGFLNGRPLNVTVKPASRPDISVGLNGSNKAVVSPYTGTSCVGQPLVCPIYVASRKIICNGSLKSPNPLPPYLHPTRIRVVFYSILVTTRMRVG